MAGGEHGSRAIQQPRSEVQLISGCQSDLHDIDALSGDTLGERLRQRRRRVAHVAAHHDPQWRAGVGLLCLDQSCERRTHVEHEGLVDLLAEEATNVVRLDDCVDSVGGPGHDESTPIDLSSEGR
ncbi:Uncharacterised protein [Mycobacteroides abscessus subsp. massiliense]|nr:Uncharacterised protein [Mycobacteroides abscessus subsp. massiliense]